MRSVEFNCRANSSINQQIVIGIIIASKVVILVISMVLGFETRSLNFKKHKENIFVGISLFTVAVLGAIGIICHQFILQQVIAYTALFVWYIAFKLEFSYELAPKLYHVVFYFGAYLYLIHFAIWSSI